MQLPLSFPPGMASLLAIGFLISLLLWVLRYYFHTILGREEMVEARLKGELLDNVAVLLLAVIFTTTLTYLPLLGLPVEERDGSLYISAVEGLMRDIDNLLSRVDALLSLQESAATSSAYLAGLSFNVLSLPLYTGSEGRFAQYYAQATTFYQLLFNLSVALRVTQYLFQLFSYYTPWLLLFGAVARAFPGIRGFGGFLMALGIALAFYPIVFLSLFQTPILPAVQQPLAVSYCSFQGFSPVTFSTSGSPALFLLSLTTLSSDVMEAVRELYVVHLLRHLISLAISLQLLRIGSIILSGQTLLTSAFERGLLAHL